MRNIPLSTDKIQGRTGGVFFPAAPLPTVLTTLFGCTARTLLRVHLCQKDDALAVWPDDMIHLRTNSLPRQLRSSKAGLKGRSHRKEEAMIEGREKRPSNKAMREGSPHQFPCLSGPYCTRYNCFSCDPNAPVSPHSYFLKVKESD